MDPNSDSNIFLMTQVINLYRKDDIEVISLMNKRRFDPNKRLNYGRYSIIHIFVEDYSDLSEVKTHALIKLLSMGPFLYERDPYTGIERNYAKIDFIRQILIKHLGFIPEKKQSYYFKYNVACPYSMNSLNKATKSQKQKRIEKIVNSGIVPTTETLIVAIKTNNSKIVSTILNFSLFNTTKFDATCNVVKYKNVMLKDTIVDTVPCLVNQDTLIFACLNGNHKIISLLLNYGIVPNELALTIIKVFGHRDLYKKLSIEPYTLSILSEGNKRERYNVRMLFRDNKGLHLSRARRRCHELYVKYWNLHIEVIIASRNNDPIIMELMENDMFNPNAIIDGNRIIHIWLDIRDVDLKQWVRDRLETYKYCNAFRYDVPRKYTIDDLKYALYHEDMNQVTKILSTRSVIADLDTFKIAAKFSPDAIENLYMTNQDVFEIDDYLVIAMYLAGRGMYINKKLKYYHIVFTDTMFELERIFVQYYRF